MLKIQIALNAILKLGWWHFVPKLAGFIFFFNESLSHVQLCNPMDCSLPVHGILQARILEWVPFSFSQGIFPTQGSTPGLLHFRRILYQLSHRGNPRILEWVAYPFSGRSLWSRNQTGVSYIAGRFFTNWAIREALMSFDMWYLDPLTYSEECMWWKLSPKEGWPPNTGQSHSKR